MKIHCTTTFLEERDRFEAGDTRTVPDEMGQRFIANGWATEVGGEPAPSSAPEAPTTLNIKRATHKTGAKHG
jgi:hypothetical protein